MIGRTCLVVLLGLLALTHGLQCPKQKISPGREVVCYTSVSDVERLTESVCKCTTLVHQGHDVRNLTTSDFEDFRRSLKEINPVLQFVISVDDSGKALRTSGTVRQEIAARLIGALKEVDGVELNMTAGSKERLLHFVKGLKDELVRKSYDKRIFLVLPTKSEDLAKQFDLKDLSKYVDLFTLPTHYLIEDDEANRTFHPSRLMGLFDMFNADSLIDLISGLGAPKRKILISVPASAYKFTLKDQDDNAPRAATEDSLPVIIDQKQLCELMSGGEWTVERDEDLTAPYAFKDKSWIAFEDKISVSIKGKYVMLRDLPGLAVHNIENDFKTKCGGPVTQEAYHSFMDFKRKSRAAVLNALEDDLHQKELEYATQVKSSDFRVVRVVDTEGHIRAVRENTQTEFTCSRQGYFVHPKSCNRFYRCVKFNQEVEDYSVFEFDCPAGLSFDERTEVCVWPGSLPQGSPCPGSSEIAPVARVRFECPSKPGYYADPQNPRWFFACIDLGGPETMAYEFRCPYGLIFDEQKFICEWPWLVQGYSGSGYTKSQYDNGYGTGSTVGTGGYYTGGLPNGYTGTTGAGVYTGSTGGVGYHGGDTGFSGAAGVGYTGGHGSSFGQGTTGSGYGGSVAGGHGATGYTGTAGSGAAGHGSSFGQGATGSGYSGSVAGGHGASYGGQGSTGYKGTAGSGAAGHGGASYGGQGSTGYTGTAGSGATGHGGASYGGQGSTGYTGTAGSGAAGHGGASYGGQGSTGYTGTAGSGATGHGGASYGGQGSTGYTGTAGSGAAGHGGASYGGQGSTGYTGTAGSGATGHGGASYGGQGSTGYSGTAGHGASYGDQGATGPGAGGHGSTFGQGTTGSGYSGSVAGGHGVSYGGQGSPGYTGATGSGAGGRGGYDNQGTTGSGYSGSVAGGHGVSYGGQGSPGYTGATGSGVGSHGASYGGQGATGPGAGGHGTFDNQGTTGSGYSGSVAGGHGVSYGGQGSTEATGSGAGNHGVSYGGPGSPGYSGTAPGGHGSSYSGQGSSFGQGTSGSGYAGPGAGGHGSGQGPTGYPGTTGTGYAGSVGKSHGTSGTGQETIDFSGSDKEGEGGAGHGGSNGPGYNVVQTTGYAGTGGTFTGTAGPKYPGSNYPSGSGSSNVPDQGYSGPGFTSHGTGSGYPGTPGPIFKHKPERPNFNCGTPCSGDTEPSGGQTYATDDYLSTHGITSGSNVYQDTHGYKGSLNVTLPGGHVPSGGSTTYFGGVTPTNGYVVTAGAGAGVIATGPNVQGSILTGPSTPGTLITYGSSSGTIVGGSTDQGSIVTGGSHPGYTKTGPGSPGYVITNGVKPVYPFSGGPGTSIYGTPSPGVVVTGAPGAGTIVKGQTSPGILLTGHTTPGVSIGGSIEQGTVVGSTGHHGYTGFSTPQGGATSGTRTGSVPSTYNTGYKTNEYYDNGGHGTIKFNNGEVATKFTENDIPDYRPAGGTIPPDTLFPGVTGGSRVSTPSGFTKTGPTKTGFTTATLGAGGSYVISTGSTYPTPNPDHIGANAFQGSGPGYTKTSTESSFDSVDSKVTLGPSQGYSYPTPGIAFETGVTKNLPLSSTDGGLYTATTPTPFLNVEVYNTPKFYHRPSGFTRGPVPISTPVLYTTGPLENYKTTLLQAAKIPHTISTVQPVFDNGYETIVSSTPVPVTLTPNKYSGVQTGSQFDYGTKASQQDVYQDRKSYYSSTTPSSVFGGSSTYSPGNQFKYGTTAPSGSAYFGSTSKSVFGQSVTPSSVSESLKPQTQYLPGGSISPAIGVTYRKPFPLSNEAFQQSTPISPIESSTVSGGSPTNIAIPRDEVGKLITNYNRGTTKYVPNEYDVYKTGSISGADYSRTQSSSLSTFQSGYGSSTPASISNTQSPFGVTTYLGGYSKPTSILTYQTTGKSTAVGKGKVIVKWSDLHPLLLGKLGAECTCRGDPFANLRGPGSKLINSSKGKVDLSNYDESEIYVDLEKEGSYDDGDYSKNRESSSSKPVKIWNEYSSQLALNAADAQTQEKLSSTYLPSVTPSVNLAPHASASAFASSRGLAANHRSGKSLSNVGSSANSFVTRPSFEGDGTSEEILEGPTHCARPGLFRHPNFCNKFYACHWDEWKKKFTLHVFSCPVHLTFDTGATACNWPSMGPACQDDNLLV